MKRRIGKNAVNACVAGLMLGTVGAVGAVAPDSALADTSATNETYGGRAQGNTYVCRYGPPSVFESDKTVIDEPIQDLYGPPPVSDEPIVISPVIDEPIICLYGPPPIDLLAENPMKVRTHNKTVKARTVAAKKKVFKKAIVVKDAVGKVRYTRLKNGSSKQLKVSSTKGTITVVKGTKKGTYKVKVMVRAAGNDEFASLETPVTVKVRVK